MVLDRKTTRPEHITVAEGAPLRSRIELGCRQHNAEDGGCQPLPHEETPITPPLPKYYTFIMNRTHTDSSSRGDRSTGELEPLYASPALIEYAPPPVPLSQTHARTEQSVYFFLFSPAWPSRLPAPPTTRCVGPSSVILYWNTGCVRSYAAGGRGDRQNVVQAKLTIHWP